MPAVDEGWLAVSWLGKSWNGLTCVSVLTATAHPYLTD